MEFIKKIKIWHIAILAAVVGLILVAVFWSEGANDELKYEPAPPEAPRLTSLGVIGEQIDFSTEVRYYEILLPEGNPTVPMVWATAVSGIELDIFQAFYSNGSTEASAVVYLDDGEHKNSYEIRFIKSTSKGFILQYDDRYQFTPDYKLKNGESFVYAVESQAGNVQVDSSGIVCATGVSDVSSTVNAYVNDIIVDSLIVDKTTAAVLDIFIVAGQGNAAGVGGNTEECTKLDAGKAYTVELEDQKKEIKDLSLGREGFTPALAEKWCSLTGEKALFIQTAIAYSSVSQWAADGEAYKLAIEHINHYIEQFEAEGSPFVVDKVFCVWLQGEWDIANGMTSEEYIRYFSEFYENIKSDAKIQMIAMIPVRPSLSSDENSDVMIEPVCAAQYMLSNMYEDIRIISRLPETANVQNGLISNGNLYYSQIGYNQLGSDVALNLYNCFCFETDKSVRAIEVYGNTHTNLFEYGKTVQIAEDEECRTVSVITPLYAKKSVINVTYDNSLVDYSVGGVIKKADTNTELNKAELCFECNGVEFRLNIEFKELVQDNPTERTVYIWEFDSLSEKYDKNDLILSGNSDPAMYTLGNGVLVSDERLVDFVLESPVKLTSEKNWDIEWSGYLNDNSIILGGSNTTKGYIYLAPFAQNMGYSIRMVDDNGSAFYLPYKEYAEKNSQFCSWRINYTKASNTITLYADGNVVSTLDVSEEFSFSFTNLLGRYGSENVNYCYTGSLDYLTISFE